MVLELTADYHAIDKTDFVIHNLDYAIQVELSTDNEGIENGIVIEPREKRNISLADSSLTIYARAMTNNGKTCRIAVENFKRPGGGGSGTAGIAQTYASIADMLADAANVKDGNLVAVISKDKVILYMRDSSIVTGDTAGYIPCGDVTTSTTTDSNTAKPWATNTSYKVNQLVSYRQSLYMCLQAHTSGMFKTDLANDCWKKIDSDQTVVGSASGYSQITKLDVEAASTVPKEVKIPINETKSFCLPPVEVLKFKAGDTNIVVTECEFDNSDSTDFTYNEDLVDFGSTINCAGAMHLLTEKKLATSIPVMSTSGYISVSDELDLTVYKSIDEIKTAKIAAGKV